MYKQVKQLSWQACIGNMHKDLGSIPGPDNFLYFLFLPQIQCKSLSHAYHAPSIINQWRTTMPPGQCTCGQSLKSNRLERLMGLEIANLPPYWAITPWFIIPFYFFSLLFSFY